MKLKGVSFCNFTTILSIILIIYISITTYIDNFYLKDETVNDTVFMIKSISLALMFVVVAFLFSFLRFYKNSYLERQIQKRTEDILNENETLKIHAHIDPLTQCLNKKYFMERFDEEFKRAIREKQYVSLIIVNIDEFKAFNDIYGGNEGNECLKLVANILVNHCNRPTDLVARFSGDEFYIMLPNTNEPKAVSQKCVDSVRSLNIPHDNSIASNILTISIGISSILPVHLDQEEELISRAKESLIKAKRAGRNRVY